MLVAWGDSDPFTPLDGPVGQFFVKQSVDRPHTEVSLPALHSPECVEAGLQPEVCVHRGDGASVLPAFFWRGRWAGPAQP